MQTFCGYIALLGRPNSGKSTLLNACLGQKIVGVSKRPQTTRNRILGLRTEGAHQLVFLDTPGLHKASGQPKLNHAMNQAAWSVLHDADVLCYLVDVGKGWHSQDAEYLLALLNQSQSPILVLASKVDSLKKTELAAQMTSIQQGMQAVWQESKRSAAGLAWVDGSPLPISAKQPEVVIALRQKLALLIPAGPWLFAEDDLTDRPEKFIVAELIREQLFRQLGQELPYGTTVIIDEIKLRAKQVSVKATIISNKSSHKPMVIGSKGQLIKKIGIEARQSLEKHFAAKVYLELYVKVVEHWVDNAKLLAEFQQLQDEGQGSSSL